MQSPATESMFLFQWAAWAQVHMCTRIHTCTHKCTCPHSHPCGFTLPALVEPLSTERCCPKTQMGQGGDRNSAQVTPSRSLPLGEKAQALEPSITVPTAFLVCSGAYCWSGPPNPLGLQPPSPSQASSFCILHPPLAFSTKSTPTSTP